MGTNGRYSGLEDSTDALSTDVEAGHYDDYDNEEEMDGIVNGDESKRKPPRYISLGFSDLLCSIISLW